MGHHARKLAVLVAALVLPAAVGPIAGASASTALVRVETPQFISSFTTLVDRQRVTLGSDPVIKAGQTCLPDSPVAALTAAIGDSAWDATFDAAATPSFRITRIKAVGVQQPPTTPTWKWAAFADSRYAPDPCHTSIPDGYEALFAPACHKTTPVQQAACFTGGPLSLRIGTSSPLEVAPINVAGRKAPVSVNVTETAFTPREDGDGGTSGNGSGSPASTVWTDEGLQFSANDSHHEGMAVLGFDAYDQHVIRASQIGKIPVRATVCVTDGQDGYCGTTKPDFNAFDVGLYASPCTTNGRDGFCGTTDTSGPVSHITNVVDQQKFKKKKGPGQIVGSLDPDPNAVKDVKLRLTRVVTTRVAIRAKKKKPKASRSAVASAKKKKAKTRYRTVKRCTAWDDGTALLETAKCGTRYGKWFPAELNDLRNAFTYSFALTLPAGSYVLEVVATDENGFKDATAAGRNVLSFTVL